MLTFRTWLENNGEVDLEQFKRIHPDALLNNPDCYTFIHNLSTKKLHVANSGYSHVDMINLIYEKIDPKRWEKEYPTQDPRILQELKSSLTKCVFGRFGKYKGHEVLSYWNQWKPLGFVIRSTEQQENQSVNDIIHKNFTLNTVGYSTPDNPEIPTNPIVIDSFHQPHYAAQTTAAAPNQSKQYSVGDIHFTDDDIRNWSGQLHFLPQSNYERQRIVAIARAISQSPLANQFKDFIQRAVPPEQPTYGSQRTPGLMPGQKAWALSSETNWS